MTKLGKRKVCFLIDAELVEAILDIADQDNNTLNHAAAKVIRGGLSNLNFEPSEYRNSPNIGDLKQTLEEIHVELEQLRMKLRKLNTRFE